MNDDVIEEIDQQQQPQQQPAAAVDAAAFTAARKTTRLKLITFLERYDEFPLPTRNDMDEWAEDCLTSAENNVHSMLCDNRYGDVYRGLDSSRDTEDEVEAIVRFFPDVVSKRTEGEIEKYPIQFLTSMYTTGSAYRCNLKAVSFIHLLVRLAFEFGSFQDNERGGLLCEDSHGSNTLHYLTDSSSASYGEVYNQRVDNAYLTQMIRLRQTGFLKREDIQNHQLVNRMSNELNFFAERRLRFLIEWDPTSLLQIYEETYACLPLHNAACQSTIQGFRLTFELGILYYPIKKGFSLLFTKDNDGKTPYQLACTEFGQEEVMKVIEETLLLTSQQQQQEQRVADDDDDDGNNNINSVGPYNIIDAFIMAAMDEEIHFDCVYFLLRRQPDLLKRLLSGLMTTNDNVVNVVNGGSAGGHDDDDDDDNDDDDDAVDNGNCRNDIIDTHGDCKKDNDDNGNIRDTGIENNVKHKNDNDDANNNENNGVNEMLIIVNANSNTNSIPNANANLNVTANNRKQRKF